MQPRDLSHVSAASARAPCQGETKSNIESPPSPSSVTAQVSGNGNSGCSADAAACGGAPNSRESDFSASDSSVEKRNQRNARGAMPEPDDLPGAAIGTTYSRALWILKWMDVLPVFWQAHGEVAKRAKQRAGPSPHQPHDAAQRMGNLRGGPVRRIGNRQL